MESEGGARGGLAGSEGREVFHGSFCSYSVFFGGGVLIDSRKKSETDH